MKHLKKFATAQDYEAVKNNLPKPNVSLITDGSEVKYMKESGDGHEYVDLGLPSGTLWAKCNVGAETETDYGNYYMYGKGASQYNSEDEMYEGVEEPLAASADTATQVWGSDWHTPTYEEFDELIANTTYEWVTDFNGSGINGGKFTAQNGNYIFLPAAGFYVQEELADANTGGHYWYSTPLNTITMAESHWISDENNEYTEADRVCGFSIRPVKDV